MNISQINLEVNFPNDEPFFDVYDKINDDDTITVIHMDASIDISADTMVEITEYHVVSCVDYYELLELLKCKKLHISIEGEDQSLIHTYSDDTVNVCEMLNDHGTFQDMIHVICGYGFALKKKTKLKKLSTVLDYFKD